MKKLPETAKVLVVGRTPPPYLGAPIMLGFLVQSQLQGVDLRHLPIRLSDDDGQIGRFGWKKLLRMLQFVLRIIRVHFAHGSQVLYYAPELVKPRTTVLRDAAILAATRPFFSKTILHLHASGSEKLYRDLPRWQRLLVRLGFFKADGVIRLSSLTPDDAKFLQARNEYIVPNGIVDPFPELQLPRPKAVDSRPLQILFVSMICEGKGVFELIDACGELSARGIDYRLNIMGPFESEEFAERVRSRVVERKIEDRVKLLGVLAGAEKFAVFADSDVLCHPTYYDTFPIVLLEAMAAGLPVVSTHHSGIPSIVSDESTGILVAPRDEMAVAEALERLARDTELRQSMGRAGRERYLQEFAIARHLERMRQVFLNVTKPLHEERSIHVGEALATST